MPTTPHTIDLSQRGFITGLTHTCPTTNKPLSHSYTSIPYALPPIGPYRFQKPRALPPCYRYGTLSNPGNFTGACAICPQPPFPSGGPLKTKFWDEDCLQLNVWCPTGPKPADGWPVLFFIHGGWLQFGTPNSTNPTSLISRTNFKAIVVTPAYRVNLFGFLASKDLANEDIASGGRHVNANFGLWDQRMALEWTWKTISYFGGDSSRITLMGHSAGAYSAFHQLSYDIYQPSERRIVKKVVLVSNGPGMQPKSLDVAEEQFDELCGLLGMDAGLSSKEKLDRLRKTSAKDLIAANEKMKLSEFRAVTDGAFVRAELFDDIDSGVYASKLKEAGVEILLGEVPDENTTYAGWRYPRTKGVNAIEQRLFADYNAASVKAIIRNIYFPSGKDDELPKQVAGREANDWYEAFGRVYADLQVHAMERGFVDRLVRGGAGDLVRRYRINWRAKCVDKAFPPKMGVTHGTDLMGIWFFGNDEGKALSEKDGAIVQRFAQPIWEWMTSKQKFSWPEGATSDGRKARRLTADGTVDEWTDPDFERGVHVYDTVRKAGRRLSPSTKL